MAALCTGSGCTDALLYHTTEVPAQPNKVTFTGQVCTDNPAERQFPLRVVFLVDAAPDVPPGLPGGDVATLSLRRAQAVRDVVTVLRGPDVEFALVRYGGQVFVGPAGGFTATTQLIDEAAGALTVPIPGGADGQRRTAAALQTASSLITGDILSSPKGVRSRTTYVIVHLQSGPTHDCVMWAQTDGECQIECGRSPNDVCPASTDAAGLAQMSCSASCTLRKRIADLRDYALDNGAASFVYHSLDVSQLSDDGAWRDMTEDELTRYSFSGGGEYRPVCRRDPMTGNLTPPGCGVKNLTFLTLDIQSARNVFVKKSFIVSNLNVRNTNDGPIPDSDADGLSDAAEAELGTNPRAADTDGDGIQDRVEQLLSTVNLDPLNPDEPPVCASVAPEADTDGDGLTDCEEMLLRMDPTLFDTDADGVPDLLEFLAGTNFLDNDTLIDSDFDGAQNITEIRAHTDPRSADAQSRAQYSYLYKEENLGIRETKFTSQPREISGVTVEEVGPTTSVGNGMIAYLQRDPPVLAWRDPDDDVVGQGVPITEAGTYTLYTGCAGDRTNADPNEDKQTGCAGKYVQVTVTPEIFLPYSVDELVRVSVAERECHDFRVRNVTLVQTLNADGKGIGNNDIRIYFGQVPIDRPDTFGIYRVAQFNYTFLEPSTKSPNISDQPVESFRFVLFGD